MSEPSGETEANKPYALHGKLTVEKLREMYEVELLTDQEIADHYGVSDAAVSGRRKRAGIATMSARQRRERKAGRSGPFLDDLTPTELADLYSRMGDRQIAATYGVKKPAISRLRDKWGIGAISKAERATSREPLTDEQKEIVIGVMLGDGHLLSRGVFKVSHSQHQYEYLCHVHAALSSIAKPLYYDEKEMAESGELCPGFGFRTVQHSWLKAMRRLFYPEGERVFPASVLDNLTERSLAYWYFDDGYESDGLPRFALGKISRSAAEDVVQRIGRRFGFKTYVGSPVPNCQIMSMRAVSSERFFRIVVDFASPDMLYKVPERFWPAHARPTVKVRTVDPIQLPKELRGTDPSLEDGLLAFWRKQGFPYHVARPEHLRILANLEANQVLQGDSLKIRHVGQSSCQAFMPHIWEAHSFATPSPKALFDNDDRLREVIRRGLAAGIVFSAAGMRQALRRYRLTSVYNFRPAVAKVLVDRFCPSGGTVFDPCAGWGGRMLGTLLSRANARYVCCEPSSKTVRGLHEMKMWVEGHVVGAADRVTINPVPAETFDPPEADMVLTSPPYWKREVYADEDTQSSARYSTYEAWVDSFLRPMIARSIAALKSGGWLVLNVDDFAIGETKYRLVQDVKDIVAEHGLRDPDEFRYEMPSFTTEDNYEPVLAWPKGLGVETAHSDPVAVAVGQPEQKVTARTPLAKICIQCRRRFETLRADTKYCSDACGSQYRKQKRGGKPRKTHRTIQCKACENSFAIPLTGGVPKHCPSCAIDIAENRELAARTKACAYRHCGRKFLDTSTKNIAKFCHVEHRRREKLFRSGRAADLSHFRNPDPVLDR